MASKKFCLRPCNTTFRRRRTNWIRWGIFFRKLRKLLGLGLVIWSYFNYSFVNFRPLFYFIFICNFIFCDLNLVRLGVTSIRTKISKLVRADSWLLHKLSALVFEYLILVFIRFVTGDFYFPFLIPIFFLVFFQLYSWCVIEINRLKLFYHKDDSRFCVNSNITE